MLPSERHPNQARMPERYLAKPIHEMSIGEVRCASIYAVWVDEEDRCWLHPLQSTSEQLSEKRPVIIEKTDDGYVVDITYAIHEWERDSDDDLNNVGLAEHGLELIPIFELKTSLDTSAEAPLIDDEFIAWAKNHGISA